MIKNKGYKSIFHDSLQGMVILCFAVLASCGTTKEVEKNIYTERKPFKELLHEANLEKMIGHDERAIELFEQCLILEPTNHAVHFALSQLYESQKLDDKSLTHAEQAYNLNQTNKWYTLRLADLYYKKEAYDKTADLYAKIITEEKNIDLKFKYVDVLIKSNRLESAINMMNEIEVETGKLPELTFTKYELYTELKKPIEAQKELDTYITESVSISEAKIMVAEFYMDKRKTSEARKLAEQVIKSDPKYGQSYIILADLELRDGNVDAAFINLEKGFASPDLSIESKLTMVQGLIPYTEKSEMDHEKMTKGVQSLFDVLYITDSENASLNEYYGYFLLIQNDLAGSEKAYLKACEIDPSQFNSWLQLLNIQNQTKNYSSLMINGTKSVELFPSQPILYLLTGIGAKESKHYSEAEEWFFIGKDLIVNDPQLQSEFLYQIGDLNHKQGNKEEAEFYFEQALTINVGNINVYADRAKHLLESNRLSEAEIEIKKGLAEVPKSSKLLDIYGQILFAKKDYAAASDTFLKALYDNYKDGVLLERCGDAHFLMGKKTEGIELWEEALKNGNTSALLKRKIADKQYYQSE